MLLILTLTFVFALKYSPCGGMSVYEVRLAVSCQEHFGLEAAVSTGFLFHAATSCPSLTQILSSDHDSPGTPAVETKQPYLLNFT